MEFHKNFMEMSKISFPATGNSRRKWENLKKINIFVGFKGFLLEQIPTSGGKSRLFQGWTRSPSRDAATAFPTFPGAWGILSSPNKAKEP